MYISIYMFCKASETMRLTEVPEVPSGLLGALGLSKLCCLACWASFVPAKPCCLTCWAPFWAVLSALWTAFGRFWAECISGGPRCLAHRQGRCKTHFCKIALEVGLCPPKCSN